MITGNGCSTIALAIVVVVLAGLASTLFARLTENSSYQRAAQRACYACLGLVGAATIVALSLVPGFWLVPGGGFSLMVLGATCQFSRSEAPSRYATAAYRR